MRKEKNWTNTEMQSILLFPMIPLSIHYMKSSNTRSKISRSIPMRDESR